MKFLRTICYRREDECAAVRAEHIPDAPPFVAFQIHGADEHPMKIELYDRAPDHSTPAFCVYDRLNGNLITGYTGSRDAPVRAKAAPKRRKKEIA